MTYLELVRRYFPDATEQEADFLLWEKTCFPVCGSEEVEEQLCELARGRR